MKQALLTYLKTDAIKDLLLVIGLALLAIGLDGFDRRVMMCVIGGLFITGGITGYIR